MQIFSLVDIEQWRHEKCELGGGGWGQNGAKFCNIAAIGKMQIININGNFFKQIGLLFIYNSRELLSYEYAWVC